MAAITTIANPLDNEDLLLFYCNDKQFINLNRDPTSSCQPKPDVSKEQGPIRHPSSFASLVWKRLLYVFEVRAEDDALCSVSPEFRAIRIGDKAINTYQGILAGCGDGTTGWLYYLQKPKPEYPIAIAEFSLDPPTVNTYEPLVPAVDATNLCAYSEEEAPFAQRYCYFQVADGIRWAKFPETNEGYVIQTKNVKELTPMTLSASRGVLYLFYVDMDNRLVWISKKPSHEWDGNIQRTDMMDIADGTKISSVTHPEQDAIYIFYISRNGANDFVPWKFTPPVE